MKSVALIGTPSDQVALGLIWYTTVCGLVLVSVALVTRSVFSFSVRFGCTIQTDGQIWFMTHCSTASLSSAWLMLKPARASSSETVAVPPDFTALVDGFVELVLELLHAAIPAAQATARIATPALLVPNLIISCHPLLCADPPRGVGPSVLPRKPQCGGCADRVLVIGSYVSCLPPVMPDSGTGG